MEMEMHMNRKFILSLFLAVTAYSSFANITVYNNCGGWEPITAECVGSGCGISVIEHGIDANSSQNFATTNGTYSVQIAGSLGINECASVNGANGVVTFKNNGAGGGCNCNYGPPS